MEPGPDIVESLIKSAGRRAAPPEVAYREVFAAASEAFRDKVSRRRDRMRLLYAGAAAVLVIGVALVLRFAQPDAPKYEQAAIARAVGGVEVAKGDSWRPLTEADLRLAAGVRIRTLEDGRAALALARGESLRMAPGTEVMLDAPGRVYVSQGTVYVDSGQRPSGTPIEVVTPAGTARDLGTQFELLVDSSRLRLRVREGRVAVEQGGRSVTGAAGEQVSIDEFGGVSRAAIAPDATAWQWAESIAPVPDMDGKPASQLIAWVARETGRRLRYESPETEQRAARAILHGNIRNLAPFEALSAMLATTDLEYVLDGDIMEIRLRDVEPPGT
jgi:ferric-dicitrate binding protein FerR (iron transport regulator)